LRQAERAVGARHVGLSAGNERHGLLFDDFDAAGMKRSEVHEVDHRISVEVKLVAPVGVGTVAFKPMQGKVGDIFKSVGCYPDCICAAVVSAVGEQALNSNHTSLEQ